MATLRSRLGEFKRLWVGGAKVYGDWKGSSGCRKYAERYCYVFQSPNEAYRECVAKVIEFGNEPAWCRDALKDLEKK